MVEFVAEKTIPVEVAYARPDKQKIVALQVAEGTTAVQAVHLSRIVEDFPEIDPATAKMGLFSRHFGTRGLKPADEYVLKARDRVEIYRPLIADPKEIRRRRAEQSRKERRERGEQAK